MDVLRSALLEDAGFAHGFSLRTGGVSAAPFDTANLGRDLGDDLASVTENHRRFAAAIGATHLFEISQVHGRRVRRVAASEEPSVVRREQADALIATEAGVAIGVRVADCTPVLIADPSTGAVAAIHAGWRGVEARIVQAAIAELLDIGAQRERLLIAIGPHIRANNFEVGIDVAQRLAAVAHGCDVVDDSKVRPHVDLTAVLLAQLRAAGIDERQVDDVGGATFAEPDRFFSYRRDGKATGRHLAAIVAR